MPAVCEGGGDALHMLMQAALRQQCAVRAAPPRPIRNGSHDRPRSTMNAMKVPTAAMRIRTVIVPAIRRAAAVAVSRLSRRSSAAIKAPIQVTGWPITAMSRSG